MPIVVNQPGWLGAAAEGAQGIVGQILKQREEQKQRDMYGSLADSLEKFNPADPRSSISVLQEALRGGAGPAEITPLLGALGKLSPQAQADRKYSPGEKKFQEKVAERLDKAATDVAVAENATADLSRARDLVEQLKGPTGYLKAAYGTESAAELAALGTTVIKPVIDTLNPRGTFAKSKLDFIVKKHSPSPWDNARTMEGKLKAVESFVDHAKMQGEKLMNLFEEYGYDIPPQKLLQWTEQTESLVRTMDETEPGEMPEFNISKSNEKTSVEKPTAKNAAEYPGKMIRNPKTGETLRSDGSKWVKVS